MSAIWQNDQSGWRLLIPVGFPAETELHSLVEQAPHVLPLAGSPRLTIVGREVSLGGNLADLIAIEPTGRLAILEIKLSRNAEARRAVVAQILTYAAFLKGLSPQELETSILSSHLQSRGYTSLTHAAMGSDQVGDSDAASIEVGLTSCLSTGHFRLVLVLDDSPPELMRLVSYLEAVTEGLIIDLITVTAFEIGGTQIIVPTRIEPDRAIKLPAGRVSPKPAALSDGSAVFRKGIQEAAAVHRPVLTRLVDWAENIQAQNLAKLYSYQGKGRTTLLPRLKGPDVGLITIWNDNGAYISLWRSVFERFAPKGLDTIEAIITPSKVGQGTSVKAISDDLLAALEDAYREAAAGRLKLDGAG